MGGRFPAGILIFCAAEGVEASSNKIFGSRKDAEVHAHRRIDKWLGCKNNQTA